MSDWIQKEAAKIAAYAAECDTITHTARLDGASLVITQRFHRPSNWGTYEWVMFDADGNIEHAGFDRDGASGRITPEYVLDQLRWMKGMKKDPPRTLDLVNYRRSLFQVGGR